MNKPVEIKADAFKPYLIVHKDPTPSEKWDAILSAQLKRRDEQIEQARQAELAEQKRLEAIRAAEEARQANILAEQQKAATPPVNASYDNSDAKMFIYMHESGNRTTARNAGNCLGLGQACPGSKLLAVCPDLNDYACQDAFFTKYAEMRYNGWEGAKAFWVLHSWW